MSKKVHLVLGSGGARGIAHIGVIEMVEAEGYEIISVTGCSMGAVVGGMYCAGFLEAYKKWLCTLTKSSVFSLFDFTLALHGFVKGDKVLRKLKEFTGEQEIEDFAIPYTAVATDIRHKKEIHFTRGSLYKALRASVGIPGVFTPVADEHAIMVDGGVLNPLPLNLVNKKPGEMLIAVNLNGFSSEKYTAEPPGKTTKTKSGLSLFNLLSTSYDFTQDRLTELMIQLYPPDILIEIPRSTCAVFEFYRATELIQIGADAFKNKMPVTGK
jgi:NTE family protein